MKITVVGCGNAFSKKQYNQSFLVEEDGRKLLIDCGTQVSNGLAALGISLKDIDDIYISHAHADHAGGLEEFAFIRYDWVKRPRHYSEGKYAPRLIGNEQLLKDLWDHTLSGGLQSMEGFVSTLETFFEPVSIAPNKSFEWQGWTVSLIQQIHIMNGNSVMPTYGIMFQKKDHKTVYFTTDSQHCSPQQMEMFYQIADIIFQDNECTGVDFRFQEGDFVYIDHNHEASPVIKWPEDDMEIMDIMAKGAVKSTWKCFKFKSGVHAQYCQLAGYDSANSIKLSEAIRKKMWLSHYQDFVLDNKDMFGNNVDWNEQAKKDGFAGFVKVGMEFEV